jgi:hypothetical protein
MEPIGAFAKMGAALTVEQFCEKYPYPFLLLSRGAASLRPAASTGVGTLERVVLTDGLGNRGDALTPKNLQKTMEGLELTREPPEAARSSTGSGEQRRVGPYGVFAVATRGAEVESTGITLGCSSRCDVQVNDESVSALHALIERRRDTYSIMDNDSTTGTMVNDEVLEKGEWRMLSSGDRVTLGYIDLTFLMPAEFYHLVRRLFAK